MQHDMFWTNYQACRDAALVERSDERSGGFRWLKPAPNGETERSKFPDLTTSQTLASISMFWAQESDRLGGVPSTYREGSNLPLASMQISRKLLS